MGQTLKGFDDHPASRYNRSPMVQSVRPRAPILAWLAVFPWLAVAVIWFSGAHRLDHPIVRQGQANTTVGELWGTHTVRQSIVVPHAGLRAVELFFGTYRPAAAGPTTVTVTISAAGAPEAPPLGLASLPVSAIENNTWHRFEFDPLPAVPDGRYLIEVGSSAQAPGEGVTLWYEPRDVYPDGEMRDSVHPFSGDLAFALHGGGGAPLAERIVAGRPGWWGWPTFPMLLLILSASASSLLLVGVGWWAWNYSETFL